MSPASLGRPPAVRLTALTLGGLGIAGLAGVWLLWQARDTWGYAQAHLSIVEAGCALQVLTSAGFVVAGFELWRRRSWGRQLAVVVCGFNVSVAGLLILIGAATDVLVVALFILISYLHLMLVLQGPTVRLWCQDPDARSGPALRGPRGAALRARAPQR